MEKTEGDTKEDFSKIYELGCGIACDDMESVSINFANNENLSQFHFAEIVKI